MTTAEIESVLGSEDLRNLLEVAEQSGAVKHAELAEVLEPLELDEMEREALQRARTAWYRRRRGGSTAGEAREVA